jgi:ABC-type Na+ efflux pump permease subunit
MNRTFVVFWKELREVLRDRRVLFSTHHLPAVADAHACSGVSG